jgi:hypothetical protein
MSPLTSGTTLQNMWDGSSIKKWNIVEWALNNPNLKCEFVHKKKNSSRGLHSMFTKREQTAWPITMYVGDCWAVGS